MIRANSSAPSVVYHFPSNRIDELSGAYAEVAARLDIPYFDLYRHLINDPAWPGKYEKNDGVHPIEAGYDSVGEHIFKWGRLAAPVRLTPRTMI